METIVDAGDWRMQCLLDLLPLDMIFVTQYLALVAYIDDNNFFAW